MSDYIITDGQRFIQKTRGKYLPTFSEALAERFSKRQAEGVYNNSLSKPLKAVFYVQKCEPIPDDIKPVTQIDINHSERFMSSPTISNWLKKISGLNGLTKEMSHRKEELNNLLSAVDKELTDIMHYIEFTHLNAAQGYKAYKLTRECRIKRRAIKNELVVLDFILNKKIGEEISAELIKTFERMDGRLYSPRILDELFDA